MRIRTVTSVYFLAAVILSGCATRATEPSPAPPVNARADMHFRAFETKGSELRATPTAYLVFNQDSNEQPRVQPKYISSAAILARAVFGSVGAERRWAALDESGGTGTGYDTLYFDGDNDADLNEESPLMGGSETVPISGHLIPPGLAERTTTFGPVETALLIGGKPVTRGFWVTLKQSIRGQVMSEPTFGDLSPTGYFEGRLKVGENDFLVALLDGNGNGTYNDLCRLAPTDKPGSYFLSRCDSFLIDLDGDGHFMEKFSRGLSPGPFLQLNGQCFNLAATPDGSLVTLSSTMLPCGWVTSSETYWATLIGHEGECTLTGPGTNCLPAGKYFPRWCEFSGRDEEGGLWTLSGRLDVYEGEPPIEVKANRMQAPPMGPPLTAQMRVEGPFNNDRVYRVELDMKGKAGENYTWHFVSKNGQWVPDPEVEVRNSRGKLLERGRIEYTRDSDAIVDCFLWRNPAPGKYVLMPVVNLGPFKVKCIPTRFTVE